MKTLILFICVLFFEFGFADDVNSQSLINHDPESLIKELYKVVSTKSGEKVDWDFVKSIFIEEAIIILRTRPDLTQQFTVDGYIQDFKNFYEYPVVNKNGFEEKILEIKSSIYKDMAIVVTIYEAKIPNISRPPSKGIDFWILIRNDNHWEIVSCTNEVIPTGEELPII